MDEAQLSRFLDFIIDLLPIPGAGLLKKFIGKALGKYSKAKPGEAVDLVDLLSEIPSILELLGSDVTPPPEVKVFKLKNEALEAENETLSAVIEALKSKNEALKIAHEIDEATVRQLEAREGHLLEDHDYMVRTRVIGHSDNIV